MTLLPDAMTSRLCPCCGASWKPKVRLTTRQSEILRWVDRYIGREGRSPTYQEIADHFGLASLGTVSEHIDHLEAKGVLRRVGDNAKGGNSRHLQVVSRANR